MVPMQAQKRKKALHEPGHSSSSSFSSSSSTTHPVWTFSRTRRTTRTRTNQFMVPMRVRKQMETLHERCRSRREEAVISVKDISEPPHVGSYQKQRRFMVPMHAQSEREFSLSESQEI